MAAFEVAVPPFLDMLPHLSTKDETDEGFGYAITLGVWPKWVAATAYCQDIIGCQFRRVDRFSLNVGAVAAAIKEVRRVGIPPKVDKAIVRAIAVLVTCFHAGRTRPNKDFQYQS